MLQSKQAVKSAIIIIIVACALESSGKKLKSQNPIITWNGSQKGRISLGLRWEEVKRRHEQRLCQDSSRAVERKEMGWKFTQHSHQVTRFPTFIKKAGAADKYLWKVPKQLRKLEERYSEKATY